MSISPMSIYRTKSTVKRSGPTLGAERVRASAFIMRSGYADRQTSAQVHLGTNPARSSQSVTMNV